MSDLDVVDFTDGIVPTPVPQKSNSVSPMRFTPASQPSPSSPRAPNVEDFTSQYDYCMVLPVEKDGNLKESTAGNYLKKLKA